LRSAQKKGEEAMMSLRELLLTGEQIRAGRAILRIEQSALARASGVSLETIKRLERMRGPVEANTRTVLAICEAFLDLGVEFEAGEGRGPGLHLVAPRAQPDQRAA
jgi:transcriptional regulator with XRE-family HTH domain